MTTPVSPRHRVRTNEQAWARLRAATRDSFGMATTAQAAAAGLDEADLTAAADHDLIWQTPDGLWVVDDVVPFQIEDLAAAWLAIDLDATLQERRRTPDTIISHQSAAIIQNLGSLASDHLIVTTSRLRPTVLAIVHQKRGDIGEQGRDWHLIEGLPVSTPGRIVADLAAAGVDGSHIGTVIADILDQKLLTTAEVGDRLAPHLHRWTTKPQWGAGHVIDLLTSSAIG